MLETCRAMMHISKLAANFIVPSQVDRIDLL